MHSVFPPQSHYLIPFAEKHEETPSRIARKFYEALSTVRGAKEDFDGGYIFEVGRHVEAEIFDDFLDQARELCRKKYLRAAAVTAGSVLERHFRNKLKEAGGNPQTDKGDFKALNSLAQDLCTLGIIDQLSQKIVVVVGDHRNWGAHFKEGKEGEQRTKDDIERMIEDVQRLLVSVP